MHKWIKDSRDGIYKYNKEIELVSYPESGNQDSFEVENTSQWFNQRNDLINFYLNKYLPDGDFLDIGSGNGFQSKSIIDKGYPFKVICCEPSLPGCANAKKRGVDLVYNGTFENFPFENYNIKAVGLFDVIEHIQYDIEFLSNLYDKVNIGTYVFINVPAFNHLFSETDLFAGHFRRYNKTDIDRILNNTKFKLIEFTHFFSFYYLPMLILRVIPYFLGVRFGFEKVRNQEKQYLKNKKNLIDILSNISHKNNLKKISKGKKIQLGTSLFIVLRKF